jgi:hypothetical protein
MNNAYKIMLITSALRTWNQRIKLTSYKKRTLLQQLFNDVTKECWKQPLKRIDTREGRAKWEHLQYYLRKKIESLNLNKTQGLFDFPFTQNSCTPLENLFWLQRANLLLHLSIASCTHQFLRLGPSKVSSSWKEIEIKFGPRNYITIREEYELLVSITWSHDHLHLK